MSDSYDLALAGGTVWTPSGAIETNVGVREGRIAGFGIDPGAAAQVIDCTGLTVLPGMIDSQVHFREPGMEHKEDLESGTRGAALGGITAVFEMPNTKPLTTTAESIKDKLDRARGRAWVDHAFYVGGTRDNAGELARLERLPGVCGVKVFMGASFGDLLVADDDGLRAIMAGSHRRMAIHAEDEPRLLERRKLAEGGGSVALHPELRDVTSAVLATRRALALARETGRRVHILHVTTADEVPILAAARDIATMEVTPQHLSLSAPDCYAELGSKAQMNPPIRSAEHTEALWRAVNDGIVDVIGSDHAPHTLEEKARPYPESPSGMTGVQTTVALMLDHVAKGRLSLARLVDLMCAGPQRIFGIVNKGRIAIGYDADFTVVDLKQSWTIEDRWIASKAGWTPFHGRQVTGRPLHTILRGRVVMRDTELQGSPIGEPVRFVETLARQSTRPS